MEKAWNFFRCQHGKLIVSKEIDKREAIKKNEDTEFYDFDCFLVSAMKEQKMPATFKILHFD
ncbi:hypothetical protein EfsSVR2332_25350 [Enterococcus faecalis]|uniref:Uncharacterized protein n=1 Tax=Enterococcus faecalis TaxID=1351 RepID=A0AC59HS56_ENTFL|nr:hypothetical protein EfsSVR2085_15010 [Enterococcus faecalis]BDQ50212.1 hypothetical protein EfsSVR2281_20230 [Enterococcus faecalis]BDQ57528.1 hypothetical protein EfsSVR2331_16530 [Enterococcus faecalis]BDQ62457.1 hypothetical protein EfsSVR2332_25350 [Enterococcus faecalis]